MKNTIRWAAVMGLSALCLGLAGVKPAAADDNGWRHDKYTDVRKDTRDIRRDERTLDNLKRRRAEEARHGDWRDVHALDRQISDVRRDIRRDERNIHGDLDRRHDWDRWR